MIIIFYYIFKQCNSNKNNKTILLYLYIIILIILSYKRLSRVVGRYMYSPLYSVFVRLKIIWSYFLLIQNLHNTLQSTADPFKLVVNNLYDSFSDSINQLWK